MSRRSKRQTRGQAAPVPLGRLEVAERVRRASATASTRFHPGKAIMDPQAILPALHEAGAPEAGKVDVRNPVVVFAESDLKGNVMAELKEVIQQKYGEAATRAATGRGGCCGPSCGCGDPITSDLYGEQETAGLPKEAVAASLGCGNPTALIELRAGQTVLDLGSGGGIDVLLSARRVGPSGKVFGLDMTDEMLALARENQRRAGVDNVEFLKGEIENIPLPDNSVDVIISNCVINLSSDKARVLREAHRVLKPGGRFAVSDVVVRGDVPADIRRSVELWVGCVAGALQETEYRRLLAEAGFTDIEVEPWRVYAVDDAREFLTGAGIDVDAVAPQVEGKFASAFVRATKQ